MTGARTRTGTGTGTGTARATAIAPAAGMTPEAETRLLKRLAGPGVLLVREPRGGWGAYPEGDRRRRALARLSDADARALTADGVLEARGETRTLGPAGKARLARLRAGGDPFLAQHGRQTGGAARARPFAPQPAPAPDAMLAGINLEESPLARLTRPDPVTGRPFLEPAETLAGERLRTDIVRSTYNARVTMDWSAPPAGAGAARAGANDPAGAADGALAARERVNRALDHVGEPLSGVLLDVLWRETGMTPLERARKWPQGSAKLALKLALSRLALHYGLRGEG